MSIFTTSDLGVDQGTSNVLIYSDGKGLVVSINQHIGRTQVNTQVTGYVQCADLC